VTSTIHDYDAIVVGARPAGAATAMLLARSGRRVLILERSGPGTDTVSTHTLMRGGVLQLARWGVLDRIADAGTPPVRRTVYNYGGARREIAIKPAHGVDALYAPRRTLLDPVLAEAAAEAGAEIRYRSRVSGLVWERGRVAGVRAVTRGDTRELRAPLVIGADGIRSIVAHHTGAPIRHRGRWCTAVTYGYWAGLAADAFEWTFHPDACTGVIPTGDGLACVFACARLERIGRGGPGAIRSVAASADVDLAVRLERAGDPLLTRTWPGTVGFLRAAHGPGWALVGDAGYFKDPVVAHGLTDALRDAELLARAVIDGIDDGPDGLHDALAGYEATRDRLSLPLFETADRIASQEWDDDEIDDLVRRISSATSAEVELLAALDQPALSRSA
jgi:flavin-dependent dehydrogenase